MVIELLEPNLTHKCVRNSVGIQKKKREEENMKMNPPVSKTLP